MKCKYCKCTDGNSCTLGCHWIGPNICSNCVVYPNNIKEFLKSYILDPDVEDIEIRIKYKKYSNKFIVLKDSK